MVDSDVKAQWYAALYEEDCLRVMRLLEKHPSLDLWKQGWNSEPSRIVEGSLLNYYYPRTRSPWKGRTALHVGARRGCAQLVNQVLDLCKAGRSAGSVQDVEIRSGMGEHGIEGPEEEEATPSSTKEEILGGHSEITEAAERGGCPTKREVDDKTFPKFPSGALSKRDVDMELENLGRARSQAEPGTFQGISGNEYPLESAGVSKSVSPQDLLLEKEGEYQLDAIAMAMVNGNSEIVGILLEAARHLCPDICEKYELRRFKSTYEREMEKLKELGKVTEKVIARFSVDPIFQTDIVEAYTRHRDFNFLPRAEYLFHFLFTRNNDISRIVLAVVGDEVFRSSPTLWSFLWEELEDGQGRLPLHVAVDECSIVDVFGPVFGHCMPGDDHMIRRIIQARDGGGRTAFHRAIMSMRYCYLDIFNFLGLYSELRTPEDLHYMEFANRKDYLSSVVVNALGEWEGNIAISKNKNSREIVKKAFTESFTSFQCNSHRISTANNVSIENGFKGSRYIGDHPMPLHSIIIRKDLECLEEMLGSYKKLELSMEDLLGITNTNVGFHWRDNTFWDKIRFLFPIRVDPLMLAILVGDESMVRRLLALEKSHQVPIFLKSCVRAQMLEEEMLDTIKLSCEGISLHPLHLAAAIGQYGVLKLLTDHATCAPFVEDYGGNNALHHALHHATSTIEAHLLDYVNCEQIRDLRCDLKDMKDIARLELLKSQDSLIARKGCINLLIQLGCNILHSNNAGQVPYPGNEMDAKLCDWWHEKQEKEFANIQNTLGVAANAISVTAALVATASYVGPLQPPLGYDEISSGLQLNNVWVKIFIICDTLSFYLAIAAIILSLIPSLPMPQQSMLEELQHTRRMVTMATIFLFPSILFVLVAFASGSFAVSHPHVGSWNNGDLTIVTACIGGFFCLVTIILFSIRLARIVFGRYAWMRKIYKAISF